MKKIIEKIKNYLKENADNKTSIFWLRVISFTESSFFPIPPDPFQIILTFAKPEKWKKFAYNIIFFSVLGGIFGYIIGAAFFEFFGEKLVQFYNLEAGIDKMQIFFQETTFSTMFIAALTPIPYKLFTISAGLFSANLFLFILASIFGRGLRFFVVGWLARFVGERYAERIFRNFDRIAMLFGVIVIIYLLYKYL
ncbi:MAG TPA: DedA family protein [Candidatus Paceibacterota bacterium]|nr:DedA family protein [Candidatus Paceibacterota bacterium]